MSENKHEHTHTHTYEHTHGHSHDHDGAHSHDHSHAHGSIDSAEKLTALLSYMHHHNIHHTEELSDMKDALVALGKEDLVSTLEAAVKAYKEGNEKLDEILKKL